ncbi:potassium channel family protein [Novosphingobium sp.]|uniref:potassium channel family protein n=1 Tax=Novosphingobium sp. TaxID=1874826 RepID=UPI0022BD542C|nr:potassium channel family protein [Novosphingobium sp.]MCZ8017533.1 potassium channel family protein [Novosphingobium sp.]MCZ8033943.1 potassium channel family protein [Novosphingobium sp.]MCZ8051299.1 potassium channel family protein [Novosphingobium sp.]MCZ8059645.1 potassium channel family protein [Novosphingobium sp.]MCZ8231483.1 potassium channel family protein [Novosphingobium sp.]
MTRLQAATDTFRELALIYAALLLVSSGLLMQFEDIDFGTALYWAATTATSTGYGDISPKSPEGRLVAVALMHLSIFVVAPLIVVRLVDRLNMDRDAFTHEEQVHILEGIARIEARLDAIEGKNR